MVLFTDAEYLEYNKLITVLVNYVNKLGKLNMSNDSKDVVPRIAQCSHWICHEWLIR
jgi:hypothetical protein